MNRKKYATLGFLVAISCGVLFMILSPDLFSKELTQWEIMEPAMQEFLRGLR